MSPASAIEAPEDDAIERMIRRILRRGVAGTLVTSAIGLSACVRQELEEPVPESDRASVSGTDAAAPSVASDAGVERADASAPLPAAPAAPVDAATLDGGKEQRPPSAGDGGAAECPSGSKGVMEASGLHTATAFEYVAIRRAAGASYEGHDGGVESWTNDSFKVLSESGRPCETASDPACTAKVALHPEQLVPSFCVQACSEVSVVTTKGNDVKRWTTDEQLRDLLGAVDSADEALLWSERGGYWDLCAMQAGDRYEVLGTRYKEICPIVYERVRLRLSPSGELQVASAEELRGGPLAGACVGRVPAALRSVDHAAHLSQLGDYLASCAHLEDASVFAFERLARELALHGAPSELIAAALRAAADEVRHASVMSELAAQHGGQVVRAEVAELPVRSLEQIALENATEGCVRETFGALVGGYQAQHAIDPRVRLAMRAIARDEARHADLSHRVHGWAMEQLDVQARERVRGAQQRAIAHLSAACANELRADVRAALGMPSAKRARALLHEMVAAIWPDERAAFAAHAPAS